MQHQLLLGVDLDVAFLGLDEELLVLDVEGDGALPRLVADDDLLLAVLVVERDLVPRLGLDHHDGVLVGVRVLHRLVLAVPEAADHVGPVALPALEGDQHLVVDVREPVEAAPVAGGRLRHPRPVALRLAGKAREADLHPPLLLRVDHVGDDGDLHPEDGGLAAPRHLPGVLQLGIDALGQSAPGPTLEKPADS